jgi:hypothetical protein
MDKRITDSIPKIINHLKKKLSPDINAFLGFDACIDNIVKVVKDKNGNTNTTFYSDSRELGEYLVSRKNRSCGIELQTHVSKIGGNMVITGNALGNLGINVDCVGTFGLPEVLPFFRSMSPNCTLYSVGDTITATALEFNDSKVIMFDPGPYNKLSWEGIKSNMGAEKIKQLISGKKLISLLNWSEIENSSQIWQGILTDILPFIEQPEIPPVYFTDFSDCSRRSKNEILYATDLLARFRKYFRVILSLNQNEADLVATAMDLSHSNSDETLIKSLFMTINADVLVIHRIKDSLAYDGIHFEKCDTFFCAEPSILTGGGDNFNAGFCFALLHDLDLFQSLLVANAVSGSYVKTGISPDVNALIEFLKLK